VFFGWKSIIGTQVELYRGQKNKSRARIDPAVIGLPAMPLFSSVHTFYSFFLRMTGGKECTHIQEAS
jgi:hypothetical protein